MPSPAPPAASVNITPHSSTAHVTSVASTTSTTTWHIPSFAQLQETVNVWLRDDQNKLYVGIGAAVAFAVVVVGAYSAIGGASKQSQKRPSRPQQQRRSQTRSNRSSTVNTVATTHETTALSTANTAADVAALSRVPADLAAQLTAATRAAAEDGNNSAEELNGADPPEWTELIQHIYALTKSPRPLPPPLVYAAAKFLLIVHSIKQIQLMHSVGAGAAGGATSEGAVQLTAQWERQCEHDMMSVWKLLQLTDESQLSLLASSDVSTDGNPLDIHSLDLLAMEVAQRLKSGEYVTITYEKLATALDSERSAHPDEPSPSRSEMIMALFMTAPLLGRWKEFKKYSVDVTNDRGEMTLHEFHEMAVTEPLFPDYKQLVIQADKYHADRQGASALERTLIWSKYDVVSLTMTHVKSTSPNQQINDVLQQMSANQSSQTQSNTYRPNQMPFYATGAVCRMVSPGVIQLPMVGHMLISTIHLSAYAVVPAQSADGGVVMPTSSDPSAVDPATLTFVDVELIGQMSERINGGDEVVYTGNYFLRDYTVVLDNNVPSRGQLQIEHQFAYEMTMKKT